MSRIGKKPVVLPGGVTVDIKNDRELTVKGPKGELSQTFRPEVALKLSEDSKSIVVEQLYETRVANAGLTRALVQNMVIGVSAGYEKKLEIVGTGYLAALSGQTLEVRAGFANEIRLTIPEGVKVTCPDQMHVVVTGCDKQLVGQFAADVRAVRPAEPYKGKGIKYEGEAIRRKENKTAGKK